MVTASVFKRVHLLLDYVGYLAYAAHEEAATLKHRRVQAAISEAARDVAGNALHVAPVRLILGQDVCCASWGAIQLSPPKR